MLSISNLRPNVFISTLAALGYIFYLSNGYSYNQGKSAVAHIPAVHVKTLGDSLVAFAKTLEGLPYQAGGYSEESGFDCSGLVKFTFNHFGIRVGRSSRDQAREGYSIPKEDVKPGDIVLFARTSAEKTRVFHAGIVVSSNQDSLVMIHANKRNGVHVTNVTASKYWSTKQHDQRRISRTMRP
ncbi:MAG: C40 family peptidase [Saprospiraceae bacterium]